MKLWTLGKSQVGLSPTLGQNLLTLMVWIEVAAVKVFFFCAALCTTTRYKSANAYFQH
jgi:hypothetical protein